MVSVTQRIAQIKQPRGGYIPPKFMHEQHFNDDRKLYLTRTSRLQQWA